MEILGGARALPHLRRREGAARVREPEGEAVIEPIETSETGPFVGGLARVTFYEQSDSKPGTAIGYVDKAGRLIEEKYGYIDRAGRFVWRAK